MKLLLIVSDMLSTQYRLLLEIRYWMRWDQSGDLGINLISHGSFCIPVKKPLLFKRNDF